MALCKAGSFRTLRLSTQQQHHCISFQPIGTRRWAKSLRLRRGWASRQISPSPPRVLAPVCAYETFTPPLRLPFVTFRPLLTAGVRRLSRARWWLALSIWTATNMCVGGGTSRKTDPSRHRVSTVLFFFSYKGWEVKVLRLRQRCRILLLCLH